MIPVEYLINDRRDIKTLKKMSFSGYLIKEVLSIFNKSLQDCKIEESCNWAIELLISGFIEELFDKIITVSIKNININNPKLPYFLYSRYGILVEYLNNKNNTKLSIRNNQQIRNMVAECCFVVCNSLKTKNIGICKINDTDFNILYIESKLIANKNDIVSDKVKFGDPEEAIMILNEFNYNLNNKKYELCVYWLSWILQWEKKNIQKKKMYVCGFRSINNIDNKYCNDVIWFVWEIILKESNRLDDNIVLQIQSLYKLFKYDYKPSKKSKRLCYLLYAIKYFTDLYHIKNIYNNYNLMVQVCSNINLIFFEKNKSAINNNLSIEKKKYNNNCKYIKNEIKNTETKKNNKDKAMKLKDIADKKMRLKISKVEEIDSLILKKSL